MIKNLHTAKLVALLILQNKISINFFIKWFLQRFFLKKPHILFEPSTKLLLRFIILQSVFDSKLVKQQQKTCKMFEMQFLILMPKNVFFDKD